MSTTKSKKIKHLDAGDFADDSMIKAEQGVFQEVTPSEIRDTLGVTSAEDYDDGDFIQSDGANWVGKSVSEMKTLLALPSKVYKAFVNCSGTNNPTITVIKSTLTSDVAWTRDDVGFFTIALTTGGVPSGELTSGKTICITQSRSAATPIDVGISIATSSINFQTWNSSGDAADSLDFYVSIEVYD